MNHKFDYDYALGKAIESVKKAGRLIKSFRRSNLKVWRKTGYDIVSEVDLSAEKEIVEHLKNHFPEHCFSSEELNTTLSGVSRFQWIIDPLDGTINYVSGLPLFSVSVALQEEGETILGVIYDPINGELYTSIKGCGSFINGRRLRVSDNLDLGNSVLSFMLTSHYSEEEVKRIVEYVNKLSIQCRGLRLYVSQALELAYIASGIMDGTFCIKSRGFSAAAGALILREAGGKITDLNGVEFGNGSRSILATNSLLHDKIMAELKKVEIKETNEG